jgi:hypothetical protein
LLGVGVCCGVVVVAFILHASSFLLLLLVDLITFNSFLMGRAGKEQRSVGFGTPPAKIGKKAIVAKLPLKPEKIHGKKGPKKNVKTVTLPPRSHHLHVEDRVC